MNREFAKSIGLSQQVHRVTHGGPWKQRRGNLMYKRYYISSCDLFLRVQLGGSFCTGGGLVLRIRVHICLGIRKMPIHNRSLS